MFSVIIDETTDRSTKQMSIIVQYWEGNKMQNSFLDLVEIHDSSASGLVKALIQSLETKEIPLENVLAFSSDTTNVMMGEKHSEATIIRELLPNVILVKYPCHLIHLCASYACLKLPKSLEDLCRNIHIHFSLSSKRQDPLNEFQNFVGAAPHKTLALGQTRWLSLKNCVKRLLEQWEALGSYFTDVAFTDPTDSNDAILESLNDKFTFAYLEFLSYNLSRLNNFNSQFQSEVPNFYCLRKEVRNLIRSICSDFMSIPYVKKCDLHALDPKHPLFSSNIVSAENIYLGVMAMETMRELKQKSSAHDIKIFYESCLNFLIESVKQIQNRFSLSEPIHAIVQCLNPVNAANLEPKSLAFVFDAIPQLYEYADRSKTDLEWRSHCFIEELNDQVPCSQYWDIVFNKKNALNLPCFPNLRVVISVLLSLPFSNASLERFNASMERFFSNFNTTKTPKRTQLKNETVCGLMHMVYHLRNKGLTTDGLRIDDCISL
ncbi:uncharacterized protein [Palaemon carinicauda]|uniref:uncharacterized protein n=1 Tax=Palaemon carinicauda TaxID=392227 RepID=UPI0035B572DC